MACSPASSLVGRPQCFSTSAPCATQTMFPHQTDKIGKGCRPFMLGFRQHRPVQRIVIGGISNVSGSPVSLIR